MGGGGVKAINIVTGTRRRLFAAQDPTAVEMGPRRLLPLGCFVALDVSCAFSNSGQEWHSPPTSRRNDMS